MQNPLTIQTEQQLFNLYEQRDQLQAQQQQLMQPETHGQNIYLDVETTSPANNDQRFYQENAYARQQLAQQMQTLNTNIAIQEDKLSRIETEAMRWISGTSKNERRVIRRTQDGIVAESTSTCEPALTQQSQKGDRL